MNDPIITVKIISFELTANTITVTINLRPFVVPMTYVFSRLKSEGWVWQTTDSRFPDKKWASGKSIDADAGALLTAACESVPTLAFHLREMIG